MTSHNYYYQFRKSLL